jgi:hypothetical protein
MSNELVTSALSIQYSKNSANIACGPAGGNFTVSGDNALKLARSIATTDVTLSIGSISTIGWVWLRNLDPTNFIIFGLDGSTYGLKLKPFEFTFVRWNGAAIHAKSDTAACLLEYAVFED